MKCPRCGSDGRVVSRYCDSCGSPIETHLDRDETDFSKHLILPLWYWFPRTEVVVRPRSDRYFIEFKRRFIRARAKNTVPRLHWMVVNVFLIAFLVAWDVFSLWLFNHFGALWVGVLLVVLLDLLFLPSILLFIWSLLPATEENGPLGS
jgi:hypothetical protein